MMDHPEPMVVDGGNYYAPPTGVHDRYGLHDQPIQRYHSLEMQSNSLRAHSAAQEENAHSDFVVPGRKPRHRRADATINVDHELLESFKQFSAAEKRRLSERQKMQRGVNGYIHSPQDGIIEPGPGPIPMFQRPPNRSKAIVIKNPDGTVVDFRRPAKDSRSTMSVSDDISNERKTPEGLVTRQVEEEKERKRQVEVEEEEERIVSEIEENERKREEKEQRYIKEKKRKAEVERIKAAESAKYEDERLRQLEREADEAEAGREPKKESEFSGKRSFNAGVFADLKKSTMFGPGAMQSDTAVRLPSQDVGTLVDFPQDSTQPATHWETYERTGIPFDMASSAGMSWDECQSSETGRTYSTRPTTITDSKSSRSRYGKAVVPQNTIIEEAEPATEWSDTIPEQDGGMGDGSSTVSDDSVLLDPAYRDLIIEKFVSALLEQLPSRNLLSHGRFLENQAFRRTFQEFIKTYTKEVMIGTVRSSRRRQASKAIRRLRDGILLRLQEAVSDAHISELPGKVSTTVTRHFKNAGFREQTWREKCSEWEVKVHHHEDDTYSDKNHPVLLEDLETLSLDFDFDHCALSDGMLNDVSVTSSEPDEEEESMFQDSKIPASISRADDQDVYSYLTKHDAFSTLARNIQRAMEQHFGNTMELIRHKVMLALRRPDAVKPSADGLFEVSIQTEWDVVEFLRDQYPANRMQPIGLILALTGEGTNAQMNTVEKYLNQFWPKHAHCLIDSISAAIGQGEKAGLLSDISFLPGKRTLRIRGSEELIVILAQQLAWLGAVCRASTGQLGLCYTTFSEALNPQAGDPEMTFDITYKVSSDGLEGSDSCWHSLVGNSVIATGFPIPERHNGEIGLQIPLPIMAALAKVPLATRFCGGYVLKGRSLLLVPVEKKGASIQWHLFQKLDRKRIRYSDLSVMCPNRLLFDTFDEEEEGLSAVVCFLGWYPQTNNILATKDYDYQTIGYTNTPLLSKRTISLTGISFGFQQWGTAGLEFSLGKKDGYYHNDHSDFYEDMLDDAEQIPVILQDMEARRAWLTNAEVLILHIILHRDASDMINSKQPLQAGLPGDPSSIRDAMLLNQDIVIKKGRRLSKDCMTDKLFVHQVREIFAIFEGLEGVQEKIQIESGKELSLGEAYRLHGWEYHDIVNRKRRPQIRSTELRRTSGGWPKLMRELNAIPFFGLRFQDIIQPDSGRELCFGFKTMPKGKDYLAMDASKLALLYEECGSYEPDSLAQITLFGTQLQRSTHLFQHCPRKAKRTKGRQEACVCDRVQQLVFNKSDRSIAVFEDLTGSAALIIGQCKESWTNRLRHPMSSTSQVQPSLSQARALPTSTTIPMTTRPLPQSTVPVPIRTAPHSTASIPNGTAPMPRSTPISQLTLVPSHALEPIISNKTQHSASSSVYTNTSSSSRSAMLSSQSSATTQSMAERAHGKQALRRKPNFPSGQSMPTLISDARCSNVLQFNSQINPPTSYRDTKI